MIPISCGVEVALLPTFEIGPLQKVEDSYRGEKPLNGTPSHNCIPSEVGILRRRGDDRIDVPDLFLAGLGLK